ncbi:kptA [Symbiodinium sp. CCMP2592]|nr:kptA [Symbiodinium sp. CCMP2592]
MDRGFWCPTGVRVATATRLARYAESSTSVPGRGSATGSSKSFSCGLYRYDGRNGVRRHCRLFPNSARVINRYIHSVCPEHLYTSFGIFRDLSVPLHRDDDRPSLVLPLTTFSGGEIFVADGSDTFRLPGSSLTGSLLDDGFLLRALHSALDWLSNCLRGLLCPSPTLSGSLLLEFLMPSVLHVPIPFKHFACGWLLVALPFVWFSALKYRTRLLLPGPSCELWRASAVRLRLMLGRVFGKFPFIPACTARRTALLAACSLRLEPSIALVWFASTPPTFTDPLALAKRRLHVIQTVKEMRQDLAAEYDDLGVCDMEAEDLFEATLKEVHRGDLSGPYTEDEVRVIDDAKISGLNSAFERSFGIALMDVDCLAALLASFLLEQAEGSEWVYFRCDVLPFGASASAFSFLRVYRSVHFLMAKYLSCLNTVYFDDSPIVEPGFGAPVLRSAVHAPLNALGWAFDSERGTSGLSFRICKLQAMFQACADKGCITYAEGAVIQGVFDLSVHRPPWLIFTDGTYEQGKATAGVVWYDPDGDRAHTAEIDVPPSLIGLWQRVAGAQIISQVEAWACLVARKFLAPSLLQRQTIAWIDNEAARTSLIKDSWDSASMRDISRLYHQLDLMHPSLIWLERVASHSNPGDWPSRGLTGEASRQLGGCLAMPKDLRSAARRCSAYAGSGSL